MTRKFIAVLACLSLVLCFSISYAVTAMELSISGEKIVREGETINLIAQYGCYNDMAFPDGDGSEVGRYMGNDVTNECTWSSNDEIIATVNQNGEVTGVTAGSVTITAHYNGDSSRPDDYQGKTSQINIKVTEKPGLAFYRGAGTSANRGFGILKETASALLDVRGISSEEAKKIEFKIEDESIAKIVNIESLNNQVTIKMDMLSLGETKLIASLDYEGEHIEAKYNFSVIESMYSIRLTDSNEKELPTDLKIDEVVQLKAYLDVYGSSAVPEDITSKISWSSSKASCATVSNKGLVRAVSAGKTTIKATYKIEDETIEKIYELSIDGEEAKLVFNKNADKDEVNILGLPGEERDIMLNALGVPSSEISNIDYEIEDKSIAEILKVSTTNQYIFITIKMLSSGRTTLKASLNLNDTFIEDTYSFEVDTIELEDDEKEFNSIWINCSEWAQEELEKAQESDLIPDTFK